MAFSNLGFELADPVGDPGDALNWVYTFLAAAQELADIDPTPERPQEDFERDWGLDQIQIINFLITGGTDGTYTIVVNASSAQVVAVAQTATQIRDALLTQLQALTDAITFPVDFVANGADSIDATAQVAGEGFTFSSSSTGDPITESTTQANIFFIFEFIDELIFQTLYEGAAFIESTLAETYALADGQTLTVVVDGGGPQTVTFVTADFVAIGVATANEVATRITTDLTGAFADRLPGGFVRIVSETRGGGSSLSVTGGTAAAAFAFPAGSQTEPSTPEFGEDFEEGWDTNQGFLFSLISIEAASYDSVTPQNFEDFEEEWDSNESYFFDFDDATFLVASYDTGSPEDFEDFEDEWQSNESFQFVLGATTAASYDSEGTPEDVEDFEEVEPDQLFTITTGSPGVIVATAHGLVDTDKIIFRSEGLLPSDLSPNLTYFVRPPINVNDFTVSKEVAGGSIDISDPGFGPHFFVQNKAAFWTLVAETV